MKSLLRCPYCPKRYTSSKFGVKNLNAHIADKHPFAYKYEIKSMYDNLIEELKYEMSKL